MFISLPLLRVGLHVIFLSKKNIKRGRRREKDTDLGGERRKTEKGKSKRLTHRAGCGFWGWGGAWREVA